MKKMQKAGIVMLSAGVLGWVAPAVVPSVLNLNGGVVYAVEKPHKVTITYNFYDDPMSPFSSSSSSKVVDVTPNQPLSDHIPETFPGGYVFYGAGGYIGAHGEGGSSKELLKRNDLFGNWTNVSVTYPRRSNGSRTNPSNAGTNNNEKPHKVTIHYSLYNGYHPVESPSSEVFYVTPNQPLSDHIPETLPGGYVFTGASAFVEGSEGVTLSSRNDLFGNETTFYARYLPKSKKSGTNNNAGTEVKPNNDGNANAGANNNAGTNAGTNNNASTEVKPNNGDTNTGANNNVGTNAGTNNNVSTEVQPNNGNTNAGTNNNVGTNAGTNNNASTEVKPNNGDTNAGTNNNSTAVKPDDNSNSGNNNSTTVTPGNNSNSGNNNSNVVTPENNTNPSDNIINNIFSNDAFGVKVTLTDKTNTAKLSVTPVEDKALTTTVLEKLNLPADNQIRILDLKLLDKNNTVIDSNSKRTVAIVLKEGEKDVAIYHIKDNGELKLIDSTTKDGVVTFEIDHFSKFAIVSNTNKPAINEVPEYDLSKLPQPGVPTPGVTDGNSFGAKTEAKDKAKEGSLPNTGMTTSSTAALGLSLIALVGLAVRRKLNN